MLSDADLLDIAMDFRRAIVGVQPSTRYCFMVCSPLAGYLHFCGQSVEIQETLVGASNHLWLLLPDGRVLDPTADQFDATLPPIYLGARLSMHAPQCALCGEYGYADTIQHATTCPWHPEHRGPALAGEEEKRCLLCLSWLD